MISFSKSFIIIVRELKVFYYKIGENIRKLRQQKKMSQDRLSKKADLALNTIVKIEAGENPNPTLKTLQKIAKALGIEVEKLLRD